MVDLEIVLHNFYQEILPTPIEMVAVDDKFGESGKPEQLLEKYNIDTPNIVAAAEAVLMRK